MKVNVVKENGHTYLAKDEVAKIINPALCLISQAISYNSFIEAAHRAVKAGFKLSPQYDSDGWNRLCELCCNQVYMRGVAKSINHYISGDGYSSGTRRNEDYLLNYAMRDVFCGMIPRGINVDFTIGKAGSRLTNDIAKEVYGRSIDTIFAFARNSDFNLICYMAVGLYRTVEKQVFNTTVALKKEMYSHLKAYRTLAENVCEYYGCDINRYLNNEVWYNYTWGSNIPIECIKNRNKMVRNRYSKFPFRNFAIALIECNGKWVANLSDEDKAAILSDMTKIDRGAYRNDAYQNGRLCPFYTASDVYVSAEILMAGLDPTTGINERNLYDILNLIQAKFSVKYSYNKIGESVITEWRENDINLAIAGDIISTYVKCNLIDYEMHEISESVIWELVQFCDSFRLKYFTNQDEMYNERKISTTCITSYTDAKLDIITPIITPEKAEALETKTIYKK